MPKLSVIIPAYQAEETIQQAIRSVLQNTFQDYEIVVVDDGSRDGTAQLVRELSDSRIRLIEKENGGVSSARNRGIQEACGEYLMFLDSDDAYHPDYCARMLERIEETTADIVLAGYEECYGDRVVTRSCPVQGILSSQEAIYESFVLPTYCSGLNGYLGSVCIAVFRRRNVLSWGIRFPESIRIAEDKLFLVEYLLHSQRLAAVDACLYRYILQKGTATKHYRAPDLKKDSFQMHWHRILTEAGHPPSEEMLAREAIANVFSVLCNEARPGNPNRSFMKLRTAFLAGRTQRKRIRSLTPDSRSLSIKKWIACHGHLCVAYYLFRRLLTLLGRVE